MSALARLVAVASFYALTFLPRTARAQILDDATRNTARSFASQGKESFARGDYETARDLFRRAYALVPAPTIAVYEARTLVHLRRLIEAEEAYMRAVRAGIDADSPEQFRKAVRDAENEVVALRPTIPKVTIVATGPGAKDPDLRITVDGSEVRAVVLAVETPIDPGDHALAASVAGGQRASVEFSIGEGERKTVTIEVPADTASSSSPSAGVASGAAVHPAIYSKNEPSPDAAKSSPQRLSGIIVGAVGVAGLAVGIVAGSIAGSKYTAAENACPRRQCVEGTAGFDDLESFRSLRTASTVGYVVGAIGLATGATLFLTAPHRSPDRGASASLWITGRSVGIAGAF